MIQPNSESLPKSSNDISISANNTPSTSNQSNVTRADKAQSRDKNIRISDVQILGAYIVIVPFAVSSIEAIRAHWVNDHDPLKYRNRIKWSLLFMVLGLVLLIFIVAVIIFLVLTH